MTLPVVILAGGLATRMRPATETLPKALLPVNGRPFADLQLSWLRTIGVREVVFSVGYRADALIRHIGDGRRFGLKVRYAADGDKLLGTGGALRAVIDSGLVAESFGVLNGDSYLTLDLARIEAAFAESGRPALMTVMRNRNRWEPSNAVYRHGVVVAYDKSRPERWRRSMEWIDYGFLILSRAAVTDRVLPGQVADLAEILRDLSAQGQLAGHEVSERFYEIGSPQGLADLEAHLASGSARLS